jgi:FkbM family methyltransferase
MPGTTKEHWDYTLREWTQAPFIAIVNSLPEKLNCIFDIGANVGGFSHVMHERYPKAKIHAFEPVLNNFTALTENCPYATNHQFGIYYGADSSRVVSRGDMNIGAFFLEQIEAGEPRVFHDETIELRTLESLDVKPDLIKFDVEGAEENILEHSELVRNTKWLIVEWHPEHVDVHAFFAKHLPKHEIVVNIEDKQFLLCKK